MTMSAFERLAARERHVTARDLRAARAEAALARRGDLRPHRVGVGQAAHLGQIAPLRWCATSAGCAPACCARRRARGASVSMSVSCSTACSARCQAVAAQVVGAPLEQCHARRAADGGSHQRQVLGEQLILQRARAGRDQHARAGQQRGYEVGEGLAGAGARLHHQQLARGQRAADALGHAQLLAAHLEVRQCPLERPAVTEYVLKIQHVRKRAPGRDPWPGTGPGRGPYLPEFAAIWCAARYWQTIGRRYSSRGPGAARDILQGYTEAPANKRNRGWPLPHTC